MSYGRAIFSVLAAPKQIRTQRHSSTLIGLLEQLGRTIHTILPQRIAILLAEHVQYPLTRANDKRDCVELIRGNVVVVERDCLTNELVRDVLAVVVGDLAQSNRAVEEQAERHLGGQFGFDQRVYGLETKFKYLVAFLLPFVVR